MTAAHAAAVARWRDSLDLIGRPSGPCMCGHDDARHRVADAVTARWLGGDDPESIGDDHGMSSEDVLEVVAETLAVELAARKARLPRAAWWTSEVTVGFTDRSTW